MHEFAVFERHRRQRPRLDRVVAVRTKNIQFGAILRDGSFIDKGWYREILPRLFQVLGAHSTASAALLRLLRGIGGTRPESFNCAVPPQ